MSGCNGGTPSGLPSFSDLRRIFMAQRGGVQRQARPFGGRATQIARQKKWRFCESGLAERERRRKPHESGPCQCSASIKPRSHAPPPRANNGPLAPPRSTTPPPPRSVLSAPPRFGGYRPPAVLGLPLVPPRFAWARYEDFRGWVLVDATRIHHCTAFGWCSFEWSATPDVVLVGASLGDEGRFVMSFWCG